ncbi:hypothetical protein [Clostridium cellulovorans]|uniref:Uncharacterized protein n=1 Tax=Clostridium cellulovorans (strain ATCC 35296 / DSM 3052 / OCM 3 / 743B) TaxID=573061 RepID=D9SRY8_CLOC7|nr:hypothetical protein [Clostridium cellulovorans]ADL50505.1 hypothetical protein Clocel_0734 [Clostridium cellulovorans 743B]
MKTERRHLDHGDFKRRIKETLEDFTCIYDIDVNLVDQPIRAKVTIDPKMSTYDEVKEFLHFVGDDEARVLCETKNGVLKPIDEGFRDGEEFTYTLGINEMSQILTKSYNLPRDKQIDSIIEFKDTFDIYIGENTHSIVTTR